MLSVINLNVLAPLIDLSIALIVPDKTFFLHSSFANGTCTIKLITAVIYGFL